MNGTTFLGSVAFVLAVTACLFSIPQKLEPLDSEHFLTMLSFFVGVTALAVTVFTAFQSYKLSRDRMELKALQDLTRQRLNEIDAIDGQQNTLVRSFVLMSRFAEEISQSVNGSVEDLNEQAAEQIRIRLYPIRIMMQAVQIQDNSKRLDACRDAVGALEALQDLADPGVCQFVEQFLSDLPQLSEAQGEPLNQDQRRLLVACQYRISPITFAANKRQNESLIG